MDSSIIPSFGIILNRGNDLTEFFWPILHFVKIQILQNHQIPLWNNLFLAGTPLVSDPQSPIFYPFNLLALIMPLDIFFMLSLLIHTVIGGIGMYLCSKKALFFSQKTSIILALLYVFTPRLGAYLEAGHVGLIYSLAWIPFALFAAIKLRGDPKIKYSLILAISLGLIYYSHLPTFLIVGITVGIIALSKKSARQLALAAILTFGLVAVSLLPQLFWQGSSTRYLLLQDKDVYPKWISIWEALKAVFIANSDTEKAIGIGFFSVLLSFLGFLKLKSKRKIFVLGTVLIVTLIILNNASPIYFFLLNQKWYLLLRVATRFWIIATLLGVYLAGLAMEKYKSKLIYVLAVVAVVESIFWGATYFRKPFSKNPNWAPQEVYEFLSDDKSLFRVYCLSRCLSQKEAATNGLELLDGYSTVQQTNFYKEAWGLTGDYWNYYTLSIPPFGASTDNPDIGLLGKYNVKYLIFKNPLRNKELTLKKEINGFYIYENILFKPRNYEIYTPNFIRLHTSNIINPTSIVIPEVYSPGWKAYLGGKSEVKVQETPDALRAVDLKAGTNFVDFRYSPRGFKYGLLITVTTIFIIGFLSLKEFKR